MKCLIRKCSEDNYWYKDKVGEYLDVLSTVRALSDDYIVLVDMPENNSQFTAGVMKEDCLVFRDEDIEEVKAAFDQLERTLQKLSR